MVHGAVFTTKYLYSAVTTDRLLYFGHLFMTPTALV